MKFFGCLILALLLMNTTSAPANELAIWENPRVSPVAPGASHTIHSYFNTCPESPDGRWVLFYRSTQPDAGGGRIVIRERLGGTEKVLATGVTVEDAHRAACQQWVCNGEEVVWHDYRDGEWRVMATNIANPAPRILARGRQVAWGQPTGDVVPLYGPHSAPGEHWDLEIANVRTGEIQAVLTAEEVRKAFAGQVAEKYGDRRVSIFFPVLSPDLERVIFKLASPGGGDFRSKQASTRHFLIGYDLKSKKLLFFHDAWGHPAWAPDSRRLINTRNVLINTDNGSIETLPGLPYFPGTHPSMSPDSKLFLTDTQTLPFGGEKGEWGIVVGSMEGGRFSIIHRFDHSDGAKSWRRSHPHPVFSADGERVYFNVSTGGWTRLYVAEKHAGTK
jgi:hypothetical protein